MSTKDHMLNPTVALEFSSFVEIDRFAHLCTSVTSHDVLSVRPTAGCLPCQPNMEAELSHNRINLEDKTVGIPQDAHAL